MRLLILGSFAVLLPASGGLGWESTTHDLGMTPRRVRVATLDDDTRPDLVVANAAEPSLTILLNPLH